MCEFLCSMGSFVNWSCDGITFIGFHHQVLCNALLSKSNFTYSFNDVTGPDLLNDCIFTISEINKLICNDLIHVF